MKCRNCKNLGKLIDENVEPYDWCEKVCDSPEINLDRNCRHYVAATKADRFRTMSDEELAKEFADYVSCHNCPIPYCKVRFTMNRLGCKSNWIDWLKQEALL